MGRHVSGERGKISMVLYLIQIIESWEGMYQGKGERNGDFQ
jgi:hypothetical protein